MPDWLEEPPALLPGEADKYLTQISPEFVASMRATLKVMSSAPSSKLTSNMIHPGWEYAEAIRRSRWRPHPIKSFIVEIKTEVETTFVTV